MTRQVGCVALLVVALVAPEVAQDGTAADAARMQQKLEAILTRGDQPPAASRGILKTSFTDREVNAYFKLHGTEVVPPGWSIPRWRSATGDT